jgi:hypothetical protein
MAKKKATGRTNRAPKKRTKPDWAPAFLAALSETGNITAACLEAGIGRQTFYDRRDGGKAFALAVRDALDTGTDALELEARRRAVDGLARKKFDGGDPVIDPATGEQYVEREYSDTLLIFLLKAHRPEKYRERHEVKHTGQLRVTASAEELSDDELATIARPDQPGPGRRRAAAPPAGPG